MPNETDIETDIETEVEYEVSAAPPPPYAITPEDFTNDERVQLIAAAARFRQLQERRNRTSGLKTLCQEKLDAAARGQLDFADVVVFALLLDSSQARNAVEATFRTRVAKEQETVVDDNAAIIKRIFAARVEKLASFRIRQLEKERTEWESSFPGESFQESGLLRLLADRERMAMNFLKSVEDKAPHQGHFRQVCEMAGAAF